MGFAGGWTSTVGDDVVAVLGVRGEHALVSGEMGAGAWHRASSLCERHFRGGEAGDEVHRVENDMSRPVMEGVLEPMHNLCAVIDREAFVRDCWAGDVAGEDKQSDPASPANPSNHPAIDDHRRAPTMIPVGCNCKHRTRRGLSSGPR